MNILVTGIGGPTPRSIAHRLRNLYPESRLVGVDVNSRALGFYMDGLLDRREIVPSVHVGAYWETLAHIVEDESIDMAFVQPEKEVIAWNMYKQESGDFICPALIAPLKYATTLINKAQMAELLKDTNYIPKTVRIDAGCPDLQLVDKTIGYPCWIRAAEGSGGFGSLKLDRREDLEAWLFIHRNIKEFTVSEFLSGRHLANQMLYLDGQLIKNAGLHCVEYVMSDVAPSKVTGNTSFGRFINEERLLVFCEEVMSHISQVLNEPAHGVFSFDLKEDCSGDLKVTEINVRHMAYTGIMAKVGYDLVADTVEWILGDISSIRTGRFSFEKEYVFLRDVDEQPIIMAEPDLLKSAGVIR